MVPVREDRTPRDSGTAASDERSGVDREDANQFDGSFAGPS